MNGFIKKTVAGVCLSLAALAGGCCRYREVVDPCWPERYNHMARYSVIETLNAQAHNGHIMDQTIWNWQFEPDPKTGAPTDKLNAAGIQHLSYIYRRQPIPDSKVFVQTAQDIKYDQANPDKAMAERAKLDAARQQAVHNYLTFASGGRMGIDYQVMVIDPGEVGIAAIPIGGMRQPLVLNGGSIGELYRGFQGVLQSQSGGGSSNSGSSTGTTGTPGMTGGTGSTGGLR